MKPVTFLNLLTATHTLSFTVFRALSGLLVCSTSAHSMGFFPFATGIASIVGIFALPFSAFDTATLAYFPSFKALVFTSLTNADAVIWVAREAPLPRGSDILANDTGFVTASW